MGRKYIIEIIGGEEGDMDFSTIEPYTEPDTEKVKADAYNDGYKAGREAEKVRQKLRQPDLEQVRKEAYDKGFDDGRNKCSSREYCMNESYQQGLNDLWEAMQKAIKMYCEIDNEVFLRVFYDVKCDWGESVLQALFKNTPQHLIDSIRKYEQRQEEFHVGDEFENGSGKKFVVLKMDGKEIDRYIDGDGRTYVMDTKYSVMRKTGRSFPEIATVLDKMREGQEQ